MDTKISAKQKLLLKSVGESSVWGATSGGQYISFASPSLNSSSGLGGVPRGKVTLLGGHPSAGKTMCSLDLIKSVEASGGSFLYFDSEYAYEEQWGINQGIKAPADEWVVRDNSLKSIWETLIGRPETWGKAKEDTGILGSKEWIEDENLQLVVLDSLDSMVPPAQEGVEIGKQSMALKARFLSAELPRLVEVAAKSNVAIVLVLQVRTNIGVMWGDPETVSGGKALMHAASLFYNFKRVNKTEVMEGDNIVGHVVKFRVDKNKVGAPYKKGEFTIKYNEGICDTDKELVKLAIDNDIFTRVNNQVWEFNFGDEPIRVRGEDNFIDTVMGNEAAVASLKEQLCINPYICHLLSTLNINTGARCNVVPW